MLEAAIIGWGRSMPGWISMRGRILCLRRFNCRWTLAFTRKPPGAERAKDTPRISIDAKATVNIGSFSRRGRSPTKTKAADHDFKHEATLTVFGIFLPEPDDL
jgi:hypothetical protein